MAFQSKGMKDEKKKKRKRKSFKFTQKLTVILPAVLKRDYANLGC